MTWPAVEITGRLGGCNECPPVMGEGMTCAGTVVIPVNEERTYSFLNVQAGSYLIRYCHGAFNYRDGWAVTRVPASADQTWPGQRVAGYFIVAFTDAGNYTFSEAQPTGVGYDTSTMAEEAMGCSEIRLLHSGGSISMHFSDKDYDDNITDSQGMPEFALYRVPPVLRYNCTSLAGMINSGTHINTQFWIQNVTDGMHELTFTMQATGGVTVPQAPFTYTFDPLELTQLGFSFDITQWKSDCVVTINVSNGGYDTIPPIVIDMSPLLLSEWELQGDQGFPDGRRPVTLTLTNAGNGGTQQLSVTLTPVDGTRMFDSLTNEEIFTYTTTGDLPAEHPNCGGNSSTFTASVYILKNPETGVAKISATVSDNYQTYPAPPDGEFTW